ncbi:MAG: hypothetical protein FD176_1262 [Rhodospirillaceae bacterium]|nr:MAG: hypothetical protein FD176_1262 [Rhodospirillaceae bacterium]TNC94119.1 MAG: hypothetical protein FD119_3439 [Stygiobacter sp.]
MAGLLFVILMLPYAIVSGIIRTASDSTAIRANLRKDIVTILGSAALAFVLSGQYTLLDEAFQSIEAISAISEEGVVKLFILAIMSYVAFQFIKIAFLKLNGDLNFFKFLVFIFLLSAAFVFSAQDINRQIFGFQAIGVFFSTLGLFSLVFVAGLHSVFAKPILIINIIGAVISLINKNSLTHEEFFLILQLIPDIPEPYSMMAVLLSTVMALYNIAIERGILSPLPIFTD